LASYAIYTISLHDALPIFPSVDEADDSLHERAQISRRAMVHLQHNSSVAIVFDGHSSAKIVGGRHGSVQAFKRSADVCTCSAARSEEHTSELQSLRHLVCR